MSGALFMWVRGTRGPSPAVVFLRKPPANKHERENNPILRQFEISAEEAELGLTALAAKYPLVDPPPPPPPSAPLVGELLPPSVLT